MSLRTWRNGEKADVVQKIIEYNFRVLGKHLPDNILCLSSSERKLLSSEYIREGLLIFDTTENQWYKYSSDAWKRCPSQYSRTISTDSWVSNTITISFVTHLISNPIVQLYIKDGKSYIPVVGGIEVDDNFNITLSTDLPFDGKVVVK